MAERFDDANIIVGRNAVLELLRSDGGAEKLLVQRELLTQRQESVPGAIIAEAKNGACRLRLLIKKSSILLQDIFRIRASQRMSH